MKYVIEVKAKDGTWRQYKSYNSYMSAWFHNLFELYQTNFIRWLCRDRNRAYKDIKVNTRLVKIDSAYSKEIHK